MSDETKRISIGREAAIALGESRWWVGLPARDVARFQLYTVELSMPFDQFHKAVEEAMGRPVWTHEFAYCADLIAELEGEKPAPSMQDILDLIPADKRVVVSVGSVKLAKRDRPTAPR